MTVPAAAVYGRVAREDRAALLVVPPGVGVVAAGGLLFELTLRH